jgi:hypothetical protein
MLDFVSFLGIPDVVDRHHEIDVTVTKGKNRVNEPIDPTCLKWLR